MEELIEQLAMGLKAITNLWRKSRFSIATMSMTTVSTAKSVLPFKS